MSNADAAIYQAKQGGGNNRSFFRTDMDDRAVRRPFFERNRTDGAMNRECVSEQTPVYAFYDT